MIKTWEQRFDENSEDLDPAQKTLNSLLEEVTELREFKTACESQDPLMWIRFASDGNYEGPIMDNLIEECRKKSGAWTPLFKHGTTPPVAGIQLPADDSITTEMKISCIGEFNVELMEICPDCDEGDPQWDCEICGGQITYKREIIIPWTTCKEIYRAMLSAARGIK